MLTLDAWASTGRHPGRAAEVRQLEFLRNFSRRAPKGKAMRTRFDQLAKQMLKNVLAPAGTVEIEAEVGPGDAQRIDVWFVPDPEREAARAELGLLGRMASAPCLLEPFHRALSVSDMTDCLRKHLNWSHQRRSSAMARADREAREALLWVLSAGRPHGVLAALRCEPLDGWPDGFYGAPALLQARIVVLPELPRRRDTLILRLMGAGAVLREAVSELAALPLGADEQRQVMPLLVRLHIEITMHPRETMHEDEDFIASSEELFQAYTRQVKLEGQREGIEKGIEKGIERGRHEELRRLFARRLGRELTEAENAVFAKRLERSGAASIEDLILDDTRDALAAWLTTVEEG